MSLPTIRFLQPEQLGRSGSLEAILKVLYNREFAIHYMYIEPMAEEHMKFNPTSSEIDEVLWTAYEKRLLHVRVTDTARGGGLQLGINLSWDRLEPNHLSRQEFFVQASRYSKVLFTKKEYDPEYYALRLMALGRDLYHVLHPAFGWIDLCRTQGHTRMEDVQALRLAHIYWANFLGPTYVSHWRRDRLLALPASHVEILANGGILIVLTQTLSQGRSLEETKQAIVDYLGMGE
jgi:hypothetical protein